jgi:hypothetical protein
LQAGIFKTPSKGDDSLEVALGQLNDSLEVALGQLNFLITGPRFAIVSWVWSVLDNCMSGSSIILHQLKRTPKE